MIGRLLFASLRHRGRQLALIALAVLFAAAGAALLGAFSSRLEQRLTRDLAAFGPNVLVRPEPGAPLLPAREIAAVRALAGVEAAAGVRERPGASGTVEVASTAELLGLHPAWTVAGRWPGAGELARGAAAVVPAGAHVTATLTTGDRLDAALFLPLADGAVDRIEVRAAPRRVDEVVRAIAARVPGAEPTAVDRVRGGDARLAGRVRLLLLGIGAATLALAGLTVAAASAALLAERRLEIGLLLALGYTARRVYALLAGELLAVACAAALAGQLLGEWGASGLARRVLGDGAFRLTPLAALLAVGAALTIVAVALTVAVRRVGRLDAATVLRGD